MAPGHQFTHSSGVYTTKGIVLPWEEGERRQERYSETALSEAHYSGGYLYVKIHGRSYRRIVALAVVQYF
jgi:hypothetical protein